MSIQRFFILDVSRGLAVIAMASYHFGFDLNNAGYIHQDLNNSMLWLSARSLILSTFLLISGISLTFAKAKLGGFFFHAHYPNCFVCGIGKYWKLSNVSRFLDIFWCVALYCGCKPYWKPN
jgi:uncharacterized membrane protein